MNKLIAKHLFYFPIQLMRGQKVKTFISQAKCTQLKSLVEITKLRDEKLKNIINHAYHNIPYYRKIFDNLNVKPEEIKCIEDLTILPVL